MGLSRKRFSGRVLIRLGWTMQYSNSLLKTKVLFGSDYPLITPDRWMADFAKVAFKDEVRPLILKDNAVKLFGLSSAAAK